MSRKRRKVSREFLPDSIYSSVNVARFINKVMLDGKKNTAEKIVYGAFKVLEKETSKPAIEVFNDALKNSSPMMEVKSRRVGGSTYQVPVEVKGSRAVALAMKWIIGFSRKRSGRTMIDKLSKELLDAYNNTGSTIKKREDTHKMADANKAFAHFRW